MARAVADLRSLARAQTETGIRVLTGIMRQKGAPAAARVAAVGMLLDRGWGKAEQVHHSNIDGEIKIVIRSIINGSEQMVEVPAAQGHLTIDNEPDAE